jgi:thymidylate kinase
MRRRPGFLVAIIGADGAGKSTITDLVARTLPLPAVRAYLGDEPPAGVPVLPTTRWLRRRWTSAASSDPGAAARPEGSADVRNHNAAPGEDSSRAVSPLQRLRQKAAHVAVVSNAMAEEYHQTSRALRQAARGKVVLLDRHYFYDYYFHHIAVRPDSRIDRIHGRWVTSVLARPSLVICLDAPAELLYARQPEGTLEQRVTRRAEYLQMSGDVGLHLLDAARPLTEVAEDVTRLVLEHASRQASR